MTPKTLFIAATLVASTIGLGLVGYRWHQQSPAEVCKRTSHQLLKDQALAHMLQLAVQPVQDYNVDIERKVKEVRRLGIRLPDAIVDQGLNPSFRMTPPNLQDLELVMTLGTPVVQSTSDSRQPVACEGYVAVEQAVKADVGGTLSWQVIDGQPHRFAFEPSLGLTGVLEQFGIDLNLPLYHLTHHMAKVGTLYYMSMPQKMEADEAEARAYKGATYQKYGLTQGGVVFSVPMDLKP